MPLFHCLAGNFLTSKTPSSLPFCTIVTWSEKRRRLPAEQAQSESPARALFCDEKMIDVPVGKHTSEMENNSLFKHNENKKET